MTPLENYLGSIKNIYKILEPYELLGYFGFIRGLKNILKNQKDNILKNKKDFTHQFMPYYNEIYKICLEKYNAICEKSDAEINLCKIWDKVNKYYIVDISKICLNIISS